jgi:hypothetical protein
MVRQRINRPNRLVSCVTNRILAKPGGGGETRSGGLVKHLLLEDFEAEVEQRRDYLIRERRRDEMSAQDCRNNRAAAHDF